MPVSIHQNPRVFLPFQPAGGKNRRAFSPIFRAKVDRARSHKKVRSFFPNGIAKWSLSLSLLAMAGYYRSNMFQGFSSGTWLSASPQTTFSRQLKKLIVGSGVLGLPLLALLLARASKNEEKAPSNLAKKVVHTSSGH
jgi:hypothetical protein